MWGKGDPHSLLVGLQTGPATMEIWKILKKLKTDLPDEQPNKWTSSSSDTGSSILTATLFTTAGKPKQAKCPSHDE